MDESRKMVELFGMSTDVRTEDSMVSFVEEFDTFLREMKMTQKKKQLTLNINDYKPSILNINNDNAT